jgi:hypothetical protein
MNDEALVGRLVAALREEPTDSTTHGVDRERVRTRLAASIGNLAASYPREISDPNPSHSAGIRPIMHGATHIARAWLVPTFVAGALAGAAAEHVYSARASAPKRDQQAVVSGSPPREVSAPKANARTDASAVVPAAPVSSTPSLPLSGSTTSASSAQVSARDRGGSLAAEQRLLDAARAALSSGNAKAGLGPLGQHASRFPNGELAEEREALWVRVLVAAGHDDEAQVHATTFSRRFPSSLFAPVVDSALATISRRNDGGAPKP